MNFPKGWSRNYGVSLIEYKVVPNIEREGFMVRG